MILSNIETIPGHEIIAHFGLVSGNTVRAKHFGRDIAAGLKNIIGGELKGYTELLEESRKQSVERMIQQASALGANAIVNIRFSTSAVTQGAAELYCYGTAVQIDNVSTMGNGVVPTPPSVPVAPPPISGSGQQGLRL